MTDQSGTPKYQQVAAELRRSIQTGTYPVGSELPSTARLTEAYNVSTTVVRAAIRELRQEGLVLGQPGKAVYVTARPADDPDEPASDLARELRELSMSVNTAIRELNARVAALERRTDLSDS
ncbi:GntR family transcriptional regulator [Pseudonocardia sp. N23]|uniref:GntR family transcriptional regulator n=1 Tax=Pseudonocardia sp. N23 TaxID=1987376 RepID=UPI000BFDC5A0|nr:GntR family transcriptional regulator [Pseudonocardia sp. N23]